MGHIGIASLQEDFGRCGYAKRVGHLSVGGFDVREPRGVSRLTLPLG
jgi:hypothetical protein